MDLNLGRLKQLQVAGHEIVSGDFKNMGFILQNTREFTNIYVAFSNGMVKDRLVNKLNTNSRIVTMYI